MEVEWTAEWSARRRRRVTVATGLPALALTVTGMVGPFVLAVEWLPNLVLVGAGWLLVRSALGWERTYRVTPDGLVCEGRLLTRTVEWTAFEGYRVTEATLVVERSGWRPDVRCALAGIEDPEEVTAALSGYLG